MKSEMNEESESKGNRKKSFSVEITRIIQSSMNLITFGNRNRDRDGNIDRNEKKTYHP